MLFFGIYILQCESIRYPVNPNKHNRQYGDIKEAGTIWTNFFILFATYF